MANIKISELDELQKATDQDLLVIVDVDNNNTKKIQVGNLGIVESGSTDTGNWVKFSDGTMIWVGSITINQIPCNNQIGALYRCAGNTYGNVNYGIEFKETPKLFCTPFGNYPIILNSAGQRISKTSTGYILISHYQNETVFDETFNYFVIGKWK